MTITKPFPFSDRIKNIPESFIREILKVSSRPEMISFAGGLPNPDFFPVEKIALAAEQVLRKDGSGRTTILDHRRIPTAAGLYRTVAIS